MDDPIDLKSLKRQSNFQIGKTVVQFTFKKIQEGGCMCGKKQEETSVAMNPFQIIQDDPIDELEDIEKDGSDVLHDEKIENHDKKGLPGYGDDANNTPQNNTNAININVGNNNGIGINVRPNDDLSDIFESEGDFHQEENHHQVGNEGINEEQEEDEEDDGGDDFDFGEGEN